jgi:diacylglycerol kinase (ATP)
VKSFGHAARGVVHVVHQERNARVHLIAMCVAIVLAVVLDVGAEGFAALLCAIALVFFAEIVNTAVERMLDLLHPQHDARVGRIKDIAAGGVLVAAVAAVAIAAAVFGPHL